MAENDTLLPGALGDIQTQIQTGQISRRKFLVAAGFVGMGVFGGARAVSAATDKVPIMTDSNGVLVHETARCVGCHRCELACTEFNDGAASPYLARVKLNRNHFWGVNGTRNGNLGTGLEGLWGNFRIIAETCKQCPHPVPCAEACPRGAIEAHPTSGARKINTSKCIGCGICNVACPWKMPTINGMALSGTSKSSKCFLCDQNALTAGSQTECSHACPTGALRFVPWRDVRLNTPILQSGVQPAGSTTNCAACHI